MRPNSSKQLIQLNHCLSAIALASLAALGGGGGSDTSSPTPQTPAPVASAPAPTAPVPTASAPAPMPLPAPPADVLAFDGAGELAESAAMPSVAGPVNNLTHSPAAGTELTSGVYTFGRVEIFGGASECAVGSGKTCLYFVRYRQSATGQVSADSWAFQPATKTWLQLNSNLRKFAVTNGNHAYVGANALYCSYNPLAEAPSLVDGQWQFTQGSVSHRLYLREQSVAGQSMLNTANAASFPSDAKQIDWSFEQTSGVLVSLSNPGIWRGADDAAVYTSLAAFRAAHIQRHALGPVRK